MKKIRVFVIAVIVVWLAGALLPAQPVEAAPPAQEEVDRDTPYVPGEVVIGFDAGLAAATYQARASALAGQVGAMVAAQYDNMAIMRFSPDTDVFAMTDRIYATGKVRSAQPNYLYWMPERADELLGNTLVADGYDAPTVEGTTERMNWEEVSQLRSYTSSAYPTFPSEILSGKLWGWDAVQADLVWNDLTYSPYVCILDTGADVYHRDFTGRVINGYDFVNNDALSNDDNGHGTHLAGIISAYANYNADSTIGITNYYSIAVKVLNAQGYGTSYSVAAGLVYCSRLPYVVTINMSFGSTSKDKLLWNAMNYAIVSNGKVVVAAAGNQSTSRKTYPAAWSSGLQTGPNNETNSLSGALISVGAARAPSPEGYKLWVDANGNNTAETGEIYMPEQCASGYATVGSAYGSNYGHWVDIVAPGEAIYSTTPTTYPFYENYYGNVASGFDYMSGTSMAAAFVSGAASRVYSYIPWNEPVAKNIKTKDNLLARGEPLAFAVDSRVSAVEFDPAKGYANQVGDGNVLYGVPYDRDGDSAPDTIRAPYCWPGWTGTAPGKWNVGNELDSNAQNMNEFQYPIPGGTQTDRAAVYLNLAKALERGAILAEVKGASDGQAVNYGYVYAYQLNDPVYMNIPLYRDLAYTSANNSRVMLINLPTPNGKGHYRLDVFVSGLNLAYTPFNTLNDSATPGYHVEAGKINSNPYNRVTVPFYTDLNFVLEWNNPNANLDLYAWLPESVGPNSLGTNGGIIGPASNNLLQYFYGENPDDSFNNDYLSSGTLLAPSQFDPNWTYLSTTFSPYAQHRFDGGLRVGADGQGNPLSPFEYLTIKQNLYSGWFNNWYLYKPYYSSAGQQYSLLVTDYSKQIGTNPFWQQDGGAEVPKNYLKKDDPDFVYPILRIWSWGFITKTLKLDAASTGCTTANNTAWWWIGNVKGDQADWTANANFTSGANKCFSTDNTADFPYDH
ncbi:MAG: S8 family serine peptidase [Anaerolineaceae bacterium]|nr:S8 family serine peptidase [Anaerolineaceae bacterium]